jgi:hypothetical protein
MDKPAAAIASHDSRRRCFVLPIRKASRFTDKMMISSSGGQPASAPISFLFALATADEWVVVCPEPLIESREAIGC